MKLLVVEDETATRDLLVEGLSRDGHQVVGVSSSDQAIQTFLQGRFEGFLVGAGSAEAGGFELCRWFRDQGVKAPILLLSERSAVSDKVAGLDAGADDYLSKPLELPEVLARVRALARRLDGYPRAPMAVADLEVDPNTRTARRSGESLELSKKEFALLEYLVRNQGRVVTRPMIAQAVWDSETNLYTNVIDVFVAYLRKKVDGERTPRLIHTVRGKGFVVADTEPPKAP